VSVVVRFPTEKQSQSHSADLSQPRVSAACSHRCRSHSSPATAEDCTDSSDQPHSRTRLSIRSFTPAPVVSLQPRHSRACSPARTFQGSCQTFASSAVLVDDQQRCARGIHSSWTYMCFCRQFLRDRKRLLNQRNML